MSAPAANAFSLPVMTMQPMPSSASKASSAADSSSISCALRALSAFGRSSRIRPTRPFVSTTMVAYAILWCSTAARGHSALADGTTEGRASALRLASHPAPATRPRARLAFTAVDLELVLEGADRSIGLLVVAQGRAAGTDGVLQNRFDLRHQAQGGRRRLARSGGQARGRLEGG